MNGTKIKAIALIILIAACLIFLSCTTTEQAETEQYAEWREFEIITTNYERSQIMVHKKTGVCYIRYLTDYYSALSVMLNADGTPITIDQIKGE